MTIAILIPHYKTKAMTVFTISQLLKYKGNHTIFIVIIDNNSGDGTLDELDLSFETTIVNYPKDILQSHSLAFEYVLPAINTEYFICLESDAFPIAEGYLDYYKGLINEGYDAAGSLLHLSGGKYLHPCGALYKTSVWQEAKEFVKKIPYSYFPNMQMAENFQCHLMVHDSLMDEFLQSPEDYIELTDGYKPFEIKSAMERLRYYSPVGKGVFHNGMGAAQESIKTYGQRNIEFDKTTMNFEGKQKLIRRIGYEPGQFFSYWMEANNKKIFYVPTETKWLPNRENQQQEYTLMESGIKHIWCGTSYKTMENTELHDVYQFKKKQIEQIINQ